jgi:hypothetical protein
MLELPRHTRAQQHVMALVGVPLVKAAVPLQRQCVLTALRAALVLDGSTIQACFSLKLEHVAQK